MATEYTDKAKKIKADYEASQKGATKVDDDVVKIRITPPEKPPIKLGPYLAALAAGTLIAAGISKKKR
jgi:hypothetical protein